MLLNGVVWSGINGVLCAGMSAAAPITNPKEIFFFASLYSNYTSLLVYYDRYHCGTLKRNHWCTMERNIQSIIGWQETF